MNFDLIGFIGFLLGAPVIGGLITYIFNNKKLHADLVSKSRIEWIQKMREVFSEYFVMLDNLILLSQKFMILNQKLDD
ncbi:hypothetical protein [Mammaliicoccus sciuri]|uniref:hypothetical protein n=1 Tax=Mammaliicoccus sciuri TaxID=1296 RepID=UPI002896632C|nr:hypothetical protein [Mammaliicoccus sciuri]